ncbi:hypothetical protein E2C01_077560 [Portunus trituberculatus]|uniref:Uncharacterized protein n=1 Tax=Portunus trituberculatus TaxID=210409 RepID=A0A5B7IRM3_PORTR|nr:hypothetical protein [Portunus trituberculatus]
MLVKEPLDVGEFRLVKITQVEERIPNHGLQTAKEALWEYSAAESYGREVGNCDLAYSTCPLNLLELLTAGLSVLQGSVDGGSLF